jgi:hypothetical protein
MQYFCEPAMKQRLSSVFNRQWVKVVAFVAGFSNGLTFTEVGFFFLQLGFYTNMVTRTILPWKFLIVIDSLQL